MATVAHLESATLRFFFANGRLQAARWHASTILALHYVANPGGRRCWPTHTRARARLNSLRTRQLSSLRVARRSAAVASTTWIEKSRARLLVADPRPFFVVAVCRRSAPRQCAIALMRARRAAATSTSTRDAHRNALDARRQSQRRQYERRWRRLRLRSALGAAADKVARRRRPLASDGRAQNFAPSSSRSQ